MYETQKNHRDSDGIFLFIQNLFVGKDLLDGFFKELGHFEGSRQAGIELFFFDGIDRLAGYTDNLRKLFLRHISLHTKVSDAIFHLNRLVLTNKVMR